MKKFIWHYYPGWSTTQEIFKDIQNKNHKLNFYEFGYTKSFPYHKLDNFADIIVAYSLGCFQAINQASQNLPKALILFSPFISFSDNNSLIIKQLKAMKIALKKDSKKLINDFHKQASFPNQNLFINYLDWSIDKLDQGLDSLLKETIGIEKLRKITCPVLILQGKNDCINSLKKVKKVNDYLLHSQLEIITNNGHSLLLNNPKKSLEKINLFLQKNELF